LIYLLYLNKTQKLRTLQISKRRRKRRSARTKRKRRRRVKRKVAANFKPLMTKVLEIRQLEVLAMKMKKIEKAMLILRKT
jgi:hypothetical protein